MHNGYADALGQLVDQLARLPGIGRKTALRVVLFMLKRKSEDVELFADTISRMQLTLLEQIQGGGVIILNPCLDVKDSRELDFLVILFH